MDKLYLLRVGQECLQTARGCLRNFQVLESLRHFLLSLEFLPEFRESLHTEFATVLNLANDNVDTDNQGQVEDMHKCYKLALDYYPTSASILTSFGTFLLLLHAAGPSVPYFLKALQHNPQYLLAEKHLDIAKLNLLPRWHFRMLNDSVRNKAYRDAIHNAITPKFNKVLDIGSGCGLLSYYSLQSKDTKRVIAVEASEELCKIATQALGDFDKLQVINRHSTHLKGIDKSNVLITEIFDTGFFGECILGTVIHAWENLLESSAKIIPSGGEIFVTGISSETLLCKYKLANIPGLNLENVCVTQTGDPYEGEYLRQFDVEYITDTQSAIYVNLSNVDLLKNIYTSFDAIEPFTLTCTTNGTLHAFAIWFDLHLDDKISITTNPRKDSVTCWEQALVSLNHPIYLQKGQEIVIQLSCVANKVEIKLLNYVSSCQNCFKVSQSLIKFLNDPQNIKAAMEYKLPDKFQNGCDILELNPFPLFILNLVKRGLTGRYSFHCKKEDDLEFIKYIWKKVTQQEIFININSSYDVIFINAISENGTINECTFENFGKYDRWLNEGGIILPEVIGLQVQLIESPYLEFCGRVNDDNLGGFKIANVFNEYGVTEHWEVELKCLPHKILSTTTIDCDLRKFCMNDHTSQFELDVAQDGTANGILYWFRLQYGNMSISTYNSIGYFCACFICKNKKFVQAFDKVKVNVSYTPGFFKVDLC